MLNQKRECLVIILCLGILLSSCISASGSEIHTQTERVETVTADAVHTKVLSSTATLTVPIIQTSTRTTVPSITNTPTKTIAIVHAPPTRMNTITASQTSTPILTQTPDPCRIDIETVKLRVPDPYTSKLNLATAALSEYFRQYTLCSPSSIWALDDYEILQARLVTRENRVDFYFSVKPSQYPSPFIAGNGSYDDKTGWIAEKYICYDLVVEETFFYLTGGWTMC